VHRAAWKAAEAATAAGHAAIEGAQGRVELAKYRLDRTVITSPIDGIVLDRRVDVGQTVAATLMTPELFVLAEDLSRMELLADVSEADVGYICSGQSASFTVNAYRDRSFQGRVREVRNQPRAIGNVVTYTVVIDVANKGQLLRPGMPADIDIEIVRREEVTKIANTALRFRPPVPPDEVRRLLAEVTWPSPPEPIPVAGERPAATQPNQVSFVPPPLKPTKATLWQHDRQTDTFKPVPVWTAFTDNRETAVSAVPDDLLKEKRFVVEVREADSGMSEFEQAILLSQPENRRL
jgi:HlyD family secretion protein